MTDFYMAVRDADGTEVAHINFESAEGDVWLKHSGDIKAFAETHAPTTAAFLSHGGMEKRLYRDLDLHDHHVDTADVCLCFLKGRGTWSGLERQHGGYRVPQEGHPIYPCSMDFFAWLFKGVQEHNAKSDVVQQNQVWLGNGKWEDGLMQYMLHTDGGGSSGGGQEQEQPGAGARNV
jgi:hypothetical protein